jgi:hypothetical protein
MFCSGALNAPECGNIEHVFPGFHLFVALGELAMELSPREKDKLLVFAAGLLADVAEPFLSGPDRGIWTRPGYGNTRSARRGSPIPGAHSRVSTFRSNART